MAVPVDGVDRLPAGEIMARWRPGSYDPPWDWKAEALDLWSRDYDRMVELESSILADGILTPVILGDDGRVWEGHHRILVAVKYCLDVPYQMGER